MRTMTFWIWSSRNWHFGFDHRNPVFKTKVFRNEQLFVTFTSKLLLYASCQLKSLLVWKSYLMFNFYVWKQQSFWWLSWNGVYLGKDISNWPGFQDSYCLNLQRALSKRLTLSTVCYWRLVYIHLFPVIWRKSSKSDFQSWKKDFSNDFALFP